MKKHRNLAALLMAALLFLVPLLPMQTLAAANDGFHLQLRTIPNAAKPQHLQFRLMAVPETISIILAISQEKAKTADIM